jgi:hypothetical protein
VFSALFLFDVLLCFEFVTCVFTDVVVFLTDLEVLLIIVSNLSCN